MRRGDHVVLNGALLPREEAHVSVDDLGFLVGDGVFETLRVYAGEPFLLAEHLARLSAALHTAGIEIPWTIAALATQARAVIATNDLGSGSGRMRITVTRGPGSPPASPRGEPTVLVTADPWEPPAVDTYARGVEVETSRHLRSAHPWRQVKSTSYAPSLQLRREASAPDVFEVLQWNDAGRLAEGSFTNVFVVDVAGTLRTPHPDDGCLEGVTRNAVLRLAAAQQIECREGEVTRAVVADAREMFLSGSLVEIVPVRRLDGSAIGAMCPGPLTRALHAAYRAMVARLAPRNDSSRVP